MVAESDELDRRVRELLHRHAAVGFAVAVVRGGETVWFRGHGVADIGAGVAITEDTVFRIGSLTKTFTAIAVLQLVEQGEVDLDGLTGIICGPIGSWAPGPRIARPRFGSC